MRHAHPESNQDTTDAFRRAVKIIGSQMATGALVGLTQQAVSARLAAGLPCWPEHVLTVEAATGISRHELRPDIYPPEEAPPPFPDQLPRTDGPAPGSLASPQKPKAVSRHSALTRLEPAR